VVDVDAVAERDVEDGAGLAVALEGERLGGDLDRAALGHEGDAVAPRRERHVLLLEEGVRAAHR
jgi:hypothetical protein